MAVILALLALLPALLYTGYEFSSLNENERLLGEVYIRQLEAVLFSANQYAWDISNSWAGSLELFLREGKDDSGRDSLARLFMQRNPALKGVVLIDKEGNPLNYMAAPGAQPGLPVDLRAALRSEVGMLERLIRYRESEYRKLEPIVSEQSRAVMLVFATGADGDAAAAGMVLDSDRFVRDVIGRRLMRIGGEEFVLAILALPSDSILFSTSEIQPGTIQQKQALWLFPDMQLGIRLKGATVQEVVEARALRNIALIFILDLILLAGAWFVYRTIKREMEFVRMKADFVSNVSHELRTPLALIRMFGETLEMGRVKNDEKRREYYSTIVKESERLTRLVNNILDFSKMEAGKKQYHYAPSDLNAIVSAVMKTYSYHLESKGFDPVTELASSLPLVSMDAEAVTEAVINLVDNAMKYSGESKFLRVATRAEQDAVIVEVEDRGVGISREDQKKIFDTFYRVSSGLVHNTKGSGLGLSLVKHIMDAHHGKVEVESTPGAGTLFRLVFPLNKKDITTKQS